MKIKQKILLIGPIPPPVTGESRINNLIIEKLPEYFEYINTSTPNFDEKIGKFNFQKLWLNLKNYLRLYKIIQTDMVYATIGQTFFGVLKFTPYFIVAKLLNRPIIIHVHGNNLLHQYQQLKGIKKFLFKKTLTITDKGIVLSNNLKSNLTPFLKDEQITVLHNFVDDDFSDITSHILENKDFSKIKILYLSNLMTQKGIFELLDALKKLDNLNIEYRAVLAGNIDKSIEKKVKKMVTELPKVQYVGPVYGSEKKELFLSSNIFILPSYREGQPLSILEAIATGNIVITTSHPGVEDILSKNQVFYIQKKSSDSIVESILYLKSKMVEYKKIIFSNHNYIIHNFTTEIFITKIKKELNIED